LYIAERNFAVRHNNTLSDHYPIEAGVPQGSVLGPLRFLICTADIPKAGNTTIVSFVDGVTVLSVNEDPVSATRQLQTHLNSLAEWYTRWRIKLSQAKSVQITFTNRKNICPPLTFNNAPIPVSTEVKYLDLHQCQCPQHAAYKCREDDTASAGIFAYHIAQNFPDTTSCDRGDTATNLNMKFNTDI